MFAGARSGRAGGSGPLSHAFNRSRVTVELLQESARNQAELGAKVRRLSGEALAPAEDYSPRRIALAMLLTNRDSLNPDSICGLSQITAARYARTRPAGGVTVEVTGFPEGATGSWSQPCSLYVRPVLIHVPHRSGLSVIPGSGGIVRPGRGSRGWSWP
ncbi:DUF6119 family protein [Streptomyces sp. NPDC051840]|uniref:DUF6119 family protein n=1 Tax=unclassified Streptomyces TaxID=2593676 RepID=UPI00342DB614